MTNANNLPGAIQWHEGMLLSPQHFQQLSIRQEELLYYHLMAAAPFHWGVRRLKIDQVLLADGIFRVLELEAVMPDGLIVCHLPEDENCLEVDLKPYAEQIKQRALRVHLAVPAKKIGQTAVKGSLARYDSIEGKPVTDENTGESELSIPRLKPKISLLATETPHQKYTAFPLAQVAYRNETFSLTHFIPPCLTVSRSSAAGEICSAIARRLREKAIFLSERSDASALSGKGAMILETKLFIHCLVSGLPCFEALLNTDSAHPYVLYLSLCTLAGNLAALGSGQIPPVLKAYQHHDIRSNFEQVRDFINQMISEGILESHTAIAFNFENGIFDLSLKPAWMSSSLVIGFKAGPGMTEKDLAGWVEQSMIGSETRIETMKEMRILGAARKKFDSDERLVPAKGVVLYSVTADPDFIEPDKTLRILNASDPAGRQKPTEIMLYVKNPT
ncbi:MAG: type VI secretion system baseplate subunit TssK [Desulfobacterales bacterium]|nr:type VI secretion system baseplate subunit TssK [Desulfobacterales bacterium]MDD4073216.1 type VI secretion system baseplate subunit TssK [Desulfobacterales bacterium]MDD4393792.1 type VI secretion system baseplate subunit TssK [Desulfobacterales bacterium]